MMFDEQLDDEQYELELEDKFCEAMRNNVAAKRGYYAAKSLGMSEEQRLKAAVIQLTELNKRAVSIITDAVMHGMSITEEVADVRNQIVGAYSSNEEVMHYSHDSLRPPIQGQI